MHETTHVGHSRHVYEVTGETFRFRLEHSPDGTDWLTFLDGEYRRSA